MRLTPADVHNVAFKKPSIGKRGYDEDEVDAFLDIVEAELTRLIEENNDLRQQLAAYESGAATPGTGSPVAAPYEAPTDNTEELQAYIDSVPEGTSHDHEQSDAQPEPAAEQSAVVAPTLVTEIPAAPEPPAAVAPVVPQPVPTTVPGIPDHHLHAARLLGLAEETAAKVTAEANAEAETTKANARAESEKLLSDARNESERMLSEAKNSSESMVAEATAKADATVRDSQTKAETLDREAQRKYTEVMSQLTTQRTSLENKIDGLRTYEREYRSRLKGWITDQLHQLDSSDGETAAGAAMPAGVGQGVAELNGGNE